MHFNQMDGYCFSVAPQLEAPGENDLTPHRRYAGTSKYIAQMQLLKTYHGPSYPLFIEMVIVGMVLFQ